MAQKGRNTFLFYYNFDYASRPEEGGRKNKHFRLLFLDSQTDRTSRRQAVIGELKNPRIVLCQSNSSDSEWLVSDFFNVTTDRKFKTDLMNNSSNSEISVNNYFNVITYSRKRQYDLKNKSSDSEIQVNDFFNVYLACQDKKISTVILNM